MVIISLSDIRPLRCRRCLYPGAFILTTFTDCSLPMRAVFAGWFAWSVWRNGKEMKS